MKMKFIFNKIKHLLKLNFTFDSLAPSALASPRPAHSAAIPHKSAEGIVMTVGRKDLEPDHGPEEEAHAGGPDAPRIISVEALLGDQRVLRLEHRGELYTLRVTRNDRLILTK